METKETRIFSAFRRTVEMETFPYKTVRFVVRKDCFLAEGAESAERTQMFSYACILPLLSCRLFFRNLCAPEKCKIKYYVTREN